MQQLSDDVMACKKGNVLHMAQLMRLPPFHLLLHYNPEWFTFLVLVYHSCPGKQAILCPLYDCRKTAALEL